ncbi:hypothetical protein LEP1GSC053_2616 [Leptospira interrogans serovar Muenchen str. Brem 129]|nr:hypothetical protein LEP1GSC053_2616 [Leptospira interrogans serovar Muenchen str. Brem 129]
MQMNLNLRGSSHIFKSWGIFKFLHKIVVLRSSLHKKRQHKKFS